MIPSEQKITRAWADHMEAQDHSKAHAFDTPFRYSDAMGCSRALSYKAAGYEETDPMDGASLAITSMGSVLHEDIQNAWREVRTEAPNREMFEVPSQIGDLISGHVDIDDPQEDEVAEIKTVGAYKFDLSIGLVRQGKARWKEAKGPGLNYITQAGFNARGLGRSKVRIVLVSREAVSVQKAEQLDMRPLDRFTAEWVFTEDEWGPVVDAELERLKVILARVDHGIISDRIRPDDDGNEELISPDKHPLCRYCPFEHQCRMDGPGAISIREKAS